ncbi:ATP-binding SpoIIE family protein phosphatase [Flaviaesturariibacter terrae]
MVSVATLRLSAADRSYFAILKKEVHALAVSAGFGTQRLAELDIVVAEVVSNLGKHAGGGEVFVRAIEEKGFQGIELVAVDKGPGIADLKSMMLDGTSTKSTLGHGLGAIQRLADQFQIYTQPAWGTLLLARLFDGDWKAPKTRVPVEIRSLVVPKPGETACGDGFYAKESREHVKLLLGDGLGHGPEAALAAQKAIEAFRKCPDESPAAILRFIHQEVKRTRGLVATVAVFDIKKKQWSICGVGNIAARFFSPSGPRNHTPYNGIVGLNMPNTLNDQLIPYERGQSLVLCSDGIKTKWDLMALPGILRNDLALLNAALFKEFARQTDDMSVASCKLML